MAGAGYKLFNTGDVLTAAQVNTYLQEQAVMRFANSTARTTALSGVLAEGMVSYLDDTNAVEVYNGSAWVGVANAGDITGVTAGTGISGGGTSGDVTITNSMATAIDAKGDLIVGTGADTFSRLAVGATDGHVLKVKASTTTGLEWGAAGGASGLTLITSTTVSAATSKTVDNCFTSTYDNYLVMIVLTAGASSTATVTVQLRASGSSTTSNYASRRLVADQNGVSQTLDVAGTDEWYIGSHDQNYVQSYILNIFNPQAATQTVLTEATTNYYSGNLGYQAVAGLQNSSTQFDGFALLSTANMTGTIRVYGYQNS